MIHIYSLNNGNVEHLNRPDNFQTISYEIFTTKKSIYSNKELNLLNLLSETITSGDITNKLDISI